MRWIRRRSVPGILALLGLMTCLVPWSRGMTRASPATGPGENAATYYNQAFALLPPAGHPDAESLAAASGEPSDDAAALVRKYEPAVLLLRRGAAIPRADWGLAYDKGPELPIPHLNPARTMAQLLMLRVGHAFRQKQPAEALEDVAALLTLARHVGQEPFVVSKLIEAGMTQMAVDASAEGLAQAPPAALRVFDQRLAGLPPSKTLAEAIKGEAAGQMAWLRGLEKDDPASLFRPGGKLRMVLGGDRANSGYVEALRQRWQDPGIRAAEIVGVGTVADAAALAAAAPPTELPRAMAAWEAKRKTSGMLGAFMATPPDRAREGVMAADVRLLLLRAAIAVLLGGPDAVKATRDPAGGGPFEYRATPNGFELKSKLQAKGEPVSLTIGPPVKSP